MIEIHAFSKRYGSRVLFDNVSLSLNDGRIVALVGKNGIGKSTLLHAIVQPAAMDSGTITIDGIDNHSFAARRHFFYIPDASTFFEHLTGAEYLAFINKLYARNPSQTSQKQEHLTHLFALAPSLHQLIRDYSLGMRQKLYLTAALLSGAANLIFDEPFNGLDPESLLHLKEALALHRADDGLVLLSTHNLDIAAQFCDEAVFITRDHQLLHYENIQTATTFEETFFRCCAS